MSLKIIKDSEQSSRPAIRHIIAVAAGKGGVGKSTVAVNLALAMKKLGNKIGIMDIDIYGPSLRRMLPEDRMPSQKGQTIVPALCGGIKLISMAYFRKEQEAAAVRAPIANGIVMQFIHHVEWGELDYLFIDFPPGTGDVQLTLCQQASLSGAVMVTTPQEIAIMDVRKAMNMFEQVKVPILGVVENMGAYRNEKTGEEIAFFGKGGGERLAREFGVPFLGSIPLDPEVCRCSDRGTSLLESQGSARTAVEEVAESLSAHLEVLNLSGGEHLQSFELIWKEMEI